MTNRDFLAALAGIALEAPVYRLGGDGSDGSCDCVGLIIGALRRCGLSYSGVHGSNYLARKHTLSLSPLAGAEELLPGDLVYKAREKGAKGYDLPSRYAGDPDQRDYYHVGVVVSIEPFSILHCTSTDTHSGVKEDCSPAGWTHFGRLSFIDPQEESTMLTAAVKAENGKPVNLRKSPSVSAALIDRIPVGQAVTVRSTDGIWSQIAWRGATGYMMNRFLDFGDASPADPAHQRLTELTEAVADLQSRVAALEEVHFPG